MQVLEDLWYVQWLAVQAVGLKEPNLAQDGRIVTRGDDQNFHGVLLGPDPLEQINATPVGQVQVQDDGPLPVEQFVPPLQRARRLHEKSLQRQKLLQHRAGGRIILDDQNLEGQRLDSVREACGAHRNVTGQARCGYGQSAAPSCLPRLPVVRRWRVPVRRVVRYHASRTRSHQDRGAKPNMMRWY